MLFPFAPWKPRISSKGSTAWIRGTGTQILIACSWRQSYRTSFILLFYTGDPRYVDWLLRVGQRLCLDQQQRGEPGADRHGGDQHSRPLEGRERSRSRRVAEHGDE